MADVVLSGIVKHYGVETAVDGVALEMRDQELTVVVGPSGCGKSTLLKIIAGLDDVDEGDILIGGKRVNHLPPAKRDVAMVFQSYALYPHMTVFQNLAFPLEMARLGRAEREEKVRRAAAVLGLERFLDRKPGALSGGQQQRVAMGRAMVREPAVYLFDEPLSNLDAQLRVQMREEIARLQRDLRATMVYVTHDQVEAMTLADRIAVLKDGRVEQIGAPMELYHHPANQFVAGFIGAPQMNFLPGEIAEAGGRGLHVALDGECMVSLPSADRLAAGDQVTLGVRPEHVIIESGGEPVAPYLKARVTRIERLGAHTHLSLETQAGMVTAVASGDASLVRGETLRIGLPAERCHLFDAAGTALARPEKGA